MASVAPTTPDTLVTLKVNLDGTTRRFKLPLRDLGASTLEHKLRSLLAITKETEAIFERYSDSAGAYVVLDPNNVSVYKQLYRAAKAKQKLKLRLTTKPAAEEKKGPKPASVEDEDEAEGEPSQAAPAAIEEPIRSSVPILPDVPVQPPITLECRPRPTITDAAAEQLRQSLAYMEREQVLMERNLEKIEASVAALKKPIGARPDISNPFSKAAQQMVELRKQTLENLKKETEVKSMPQSPRVENAVPNPRINFAVICNSCDRNIPEVHYHCSTCDDGDFDLCQDCVDQGITCYGIDHWLIKRFVKNGIVVSSSTERLPPKPKAKVEPTPEPKVEPTSPVPEERSAPAAIPQALNEYLYASIRTCNSCVKELPEDAFVHCTSCDDFDLCKACFAKNEHGHHPKHGFVPVIQTSEVARDVLARLAPGRAQYHNAVCDGCDKTVVGVRHKCLDCPDWDYCSNCVENAAFIHPNHRFVPIYEPLEDIKDMRARYISRPTHYGICCDGPLCTSIAKKGPITYIVGDRYKCAVCHDTDFCASCEASPANTHNRTHPLIKFKSPVRGVTVNTTGEHGNGQPMPMLGDRQKLRPVSTSSRATETNSQTNLLSTNLLTVVDVAPQEAVKPTVEEKEIKTEEAPAPVAPPAEPPLTENDLSGVFQRDTIADGTVFAPATVFEQTWILRNEGDIAWPAGCSVKFISGDYMGHLDPDHPAAIGELVSSSESTICYAPVAPGQEVTFTVLLRSPAREGRYISHWRLTTKDGLRFGHRLWCDIAVERQMVTPKETASPKSEPVVEPQTEKSSVKSEESQMIFPKLEKESPASSIHHEAPPAPKAKEEEEEEYEDCTEDDGWAEDESEDGFLTDEEYDILDASDEEYLEEQQKLLRK
ncbi:hypothetical protein GQ53DRAFT_108767 [Thozetella sp. PMI_491]|nr:hypothetical protein GQ53DRAFT_108767 [Thozetella sp. PMI_491]